MRPLAPALALTLALPLALPACLIVPDPSSSSGSGVVEHFESIVVPLQVLEVDFVPGPVVGKPYPRQIPAGGGRPPYRFSVGEGALPAGLALDDLGRITGTPTATGPFSFGVVVEDSLGDRATGTIAGSARASGTIPFRVAVLDTLAFGLDGDVGFQPFVLGGTPPYAFEVDGLPTGVAADAATGLIFGRAGAPGAFSITLRASDAKGATPAGSPAKMTLEIVEPRPVGSGSP